MNEKLRRIFVRKTPRNKPNNYISIRTQKTIISQKTTIKNLKKKCTILFEDDENKYINKVRINVRHNDRTMELNIGRNDLDYAVNTINNFIKYMQLTIL